MTVGQVRRHLHQQLRRSARAGHVVGENRNADHSGQRVHNEQIDGQGALTGRLSFRRPIHSPEGFVGTDLRRQLAGIEPRLSPMDADCDLETTLPERPSSRQMSPDWPRAIKAKHRLAANRPGEVAFASSTTPRARRNSRLGSWSKTQLAQRRVDTSLCPLTSMWTIVIHREKGVTTVWCQQRRKDSGRASWSGQGQRLGQNADSLQQPCCWP